MDESRTFSTKERKKLAKTGAAMPHGGFPIKNAQDLKNAIRAYGRAANKAAAKAHIIKRAKALGLTKLLPADWAMVIGPEVHWISCPDCAEEQRDRRFLTEDLLAEHADALHPEAS